MARHCGFNEGRSARHSSLEGGGRGGVAVNPPLRLRGEALRLEAEAGQGGAGGAERRRGRSTQGPGASAASGLRGQRGGSRQSR